MSGTKVRLHHFPKYCKLENMRNGAPRACQSRESEFMRSLTLLKTTGARWRIEVRTTSRIIPVLALAAALAASGAFAQQSQPKAGKQPGSGQTGMMSGNMGDRCKQMMAMHSQMMADMKAMDASLDQKVIAMNAARGNAKVDAMAAVINEMATQRKQMVAKMSSMPDKMMAHMSEHMAQSGSTAMRQSMAQCPMMQGMKGMDEKSADAHK